MKPELDKALCEKYPKIFADRNAPVTETPMGFGFECGDGWYDIIDALCSNIENRLYNNRMRLEAVAKDTKHREMAANNDWSFLYSRSAMFPEWLEDPKNLEQKKMRYLMPRPEWMNEIQEIPEVVATQVKEKYAGLRFYYDGGDEYIQGLVDMAESMSLRTCEACGKPGKQRGTGWIYTACDEHADHQ